MFSTTKSIVAFVIIVFLFGVFQIGCNKGGTSNPVAAITGETVSDMNAANVSFQLVFPQKEVGVQSANILGIVASEAVVTFQIKLLNYGNSSNPFFVISKQVPVVNGSASAIFESLPTTTVLGKIHIENGKIEGYSDFHGALDLIQGENPVKLAPIGSLMPQDVVANAVEEIVSSSTLFLTAPQTLVFELNKIVSALLLDSSTAYDEVISNFTNRNGLPIVEIIFPAGDQTFATGSNIELVASATDLDGNISKVEFYQGLNKIGEVTSAPFSYIWRCTASGSYNISAKAFDNNSAVGNAPPITINVINHYSITYSGNGNTTGSVPTDSLTYQQSAIVTVKDNTGSLVKTGYTFAGWNTTADGSGTSYNAGATFAMASANVTIYAKWSLIPTYSVTYNGNGNTSGFVPTDSLTYQQSATVTIKDNTGSLAKTGYTFAGWNTAADGSGTSYTTGATFAMVSTNITLYAKWALIQVTGLSLDYSNLSMVLGQSKALVATISPNDAADKTVTWNSSNNSVATVNNGLITPVANGNTTITVLSQSSGHTATCVITVGYTDEIYFNFDSETHTILSYSKIGGTSVSIPPTIGGVTVEVIGDQAFLNKDLTHLTLPEGITKIGVHSFAFNCSLTSIIIPSSITTIGAYAFAYDTLTSITIPNTVTSIGYYAFSHNLISTITLGTGISLIEEETFSSNSLTSVTFGSNITSIGKGAFKDNSISSITIGSDVTILDAFADNVTAEAFATAYKNNSKAAGTYTGTPGGSWIVP